MKKRIFSLIGILMACMLLLPALPALAADSTSPGDQFKPGESMTLPSNTVWATLTANWAVRIRFEDSDGAVLKEEVVPVTDATPGKSSAPGDPSKEGYRFKGWERVGGDDPNVTLHDDGTVTDITGPGPIVYRAAYEKELHVTYVVNGDASYGIPGDSVTPTDSNVYYPGDPVTVAGSPSTGWTTSDGTTGGVPGTWSFSGWDASDFTIEEDTTITGSWKFTPVLLGSLRISKTVKGDLASPTDSFTFTVYLGASGSYSYTGTYSGSISNGGKISLRHGESITITGIPAGTKYSVAESAPGGYSVHSKDAGGTIAADQTMHAQFTNIKSSVPKTGDSSRTILWICLMAVALFGLMWILLVSRKKKRGKE